MQVSGNGIVVTVSETASKEGIAAFWKGLTFAFGRELSYTSVKLGAYAPVRDFLGAGKDAPFYMKFLAGAITGGVGSFIGNPFDVLKTLAQTNKDKAVPLMTLVSNMHQQQGIAGFYRGVEANVLRACVLNATKMGCYDISKGYVTDLSTLHSFGWIFADRQCWFLTNLPMLILFFAAGWERKDIRTSFSSAFVAGFFMTCTVSPFDRIRTNLMNQPTDKKIYDGFVDCVAKTVKADGVASLWRGFIPMYVFGKFDCHWTANLVGRPMIFSPSTTNVFLCVL